MTTGEHLDPESTAPDLPDGYDPDGGWEPHEWLEAWDDVDWWHNEGARLSHPEWFDVQRPADFDDEERRP